MDSQHQFSLPGLEIEELFHIGLPLDDHVVTGDTEICCTRCHVFRNIDGTGEQDLHMRIEGTGDEPPFPGLCEVKPALFHQFHDRLCNPALIGDCKTHNIRKRSGGIAFFSAAFIVFLGFTAFTVFPVCDQNVLSSPRMTASVTWVTVASFSSTIERISLLMSLSLMPHCGSTCTLATSG